MGQIRTFVAVDVSAKIKNAAFKTIHRLSSQALDYNWVEKENLHITLNFLGDVEESEVPAVCKLIGAALTDVESFDLSVESLGCFPNLEKPRVVWLGVGRGKDELVEINRLLTDALEKMRFPRERNDFQPHLTLGRLRRGGRYSQLLASSIQSGNKQTFGEVLIEEVVVYSSYLDRTGPTYTAMSRVSLC